MNAHAKLIFIGLNALKTTRNLTALTGPCLFVLFGSTFKFNCFSLSLKELFPVGCRRCPSRFIMLYSCIAPAPGSLHQQAAHTGSLLQSFDQQIVPYLAHCLACLNCFVCNCTCSCF